MEMDIKKVEGKGKKMEREKGNREKLFSTGDGEVLTAITIHFFTLFPQLVESYFHYSIMNRALNRKLFQIKLINFRQFATNQWKKVDTPVAGGGAGMVIDNSALRNALVTYRQHYPDSRTIFLTPVGKPFTQSDARRWSRERNIFLVAGRYEGFDERLIEDLAEEVISIGEYILSGGELPALVVADGILRNVPGVVGNQDSLKGESFGIGDGEYLLEAPNFSKMGSIPPILKSGNHQLIAQWRKKLALFKTQFHTPFLLERTTDRNNSK